MPVNIPKPMADFSNQNMTIMMFWPNSRTAGWADLDIRLRFDHETDEFTFLNNYVSWIEDTFGQIVDALIALAEGGEEASAHANMEPERIEFKFRRNSETTDTLSLTVLEWSPYRDEGDHLVWDGLMPWKEIGTADGLAVKHLVDDVLWIGAALEKMFGIDGYKETWGYPLPVEKLKQLSD